MADTVAQEAVMQPDNAIRAEDRLWIGGIVQLGRLRHQGKPMRVAAWIDVSGNVLAAAIVEGHRPTVLRELVVELLASPERRWQPRELVVWPNARSAFRGFEHPPVTIERDGFLTVVVHDQFSFGHFPGRLGVRVGCAKRGDRSSTSAH